VAGPREVNLVDLGVHGPRVHPLLPVGVVAVEDLQRDRPAEGPSVPDAARHLDAIALDLHAAAPAMAELPSAQVAVDRFAPDREAGGHALDDARQPRAV
jgi:hypothetical protein